MLHMHCSQFTNEHTYLFCNKLRLTLQIDISDYLEKITLFCLFTRESSVYVFGARRRNNHRKNDRRHIGSSSFQEAGK